MSLSLIKKKLQSYSNKNKVKIYKNFHKTGKEGYASGEKFLGITVPNIRKVALNNLNLSNEDILVLLNSNIHEEKYLATEIIVGKYNLSNDKKDIFDFYIDNASKMSGWDLVDNSASRVAGKFLYYFGKEYPIYKILLTGLAKSSNIWERRIAIVSTYYFIKKGDFSETLKVSEILLNDKHDLIHKAVGWMLRELGKRDEKSLKEFLNKHYNSMPRTMLRYSIEKFPEKERKAYLKGEIK